MTTPTPKKGHRLWILFIIIGLTLAACGFLQTDLILEANFRAWLTALVLILALAAAFLWFLFLSRLGWRVRVGGGLLVALVLFGGNKLVRKEGSVSGTGLPRLVWVWTPKPDGLVTTPPVIAAVTNKALASKSDIPEVPQFFGPNRDGVVNGANLDPHWEIHPPQELWRQPIGLGWSSFAVVSGRAITQEQRGEDELVTCYDVLTGALVWAHTNHVHFSQWQGGDGPRATPCVSDGKVFTMGGTGILDCLDVTDGKALWSHDVLKENSLSNIIWGLSASPLAYEGKVVVSGGSNQGPSLIAYQAKDGKLLWKTGTGRASYASPRLATVCGKRVVVVINAGSLSLHDPESGEVELDYNWPVERWPKASQPVVLDGDRIFLSAGYGVGCVMVQVKPGADKKLIAEELWKNKIMKTQFNSVSARNGLLYGMDDGLMACVDAATGERKWKDGRFGAGQSLLVDDLLLVQSESGAVHLIAAKPDGYEELAKLNALSSKTWNHPVLAGRYLLVRNDQEAACYKLPTQDGRTAGNR